MKKPENPDMPKNPKIPKVPKKKLLIGGGILVVVLAAAIFGYRMLTNSSSDTAIMTSKVTKGDISLTITGSGTLEPVESYDVVSLVEGDILADYITEGQTVEKGDTLYEISHDDMSSSISKGLLSVEKAQLSYQESLDTIKELSVKAPISGTIENLYVEEGDDVASGAQIADIINDDDGVVTVEFPKAAADELYIGEAASVLLEDCFDTVPGTVTRIASGSRNVDDYIRVTDVEITLDDPGNIADGQSCIITVGSYTSPYSGTFAYGEAKTVVASSSGTISNLNLETGDSVNKGEIIAKISSDSAQSSAKNSKMSLEEAKLSLENLYDQLDKYTITSPIAGTVIEKTSKAGDTLDGDQSTVMAVIADMSKMVFTIDVDELDITSISTGQEVEITADAQPNQTYTGYVNNISAIGTTSDGVTTYPVEVVIEDYDGLISGMNVNASIVVNESEDTLLVPVAALSRGNWIAVKDSSLSESTGTSGTAATMDMTTADTSTAKTAKSKPSGKVSATPEAPDGFTYVQVETGLSNDDYVEILSGLEEGQEVLLTQTATTTSTTTNMGGMGAMTMTNGGGPSGGGAPPDGGGRPGGGGQ